ETLPNSVSGKDTDPAGSPFYSRTNAKADPQMGSGTKGMGNAHFKYFPVIPHKADRPPMRKVERLRAISLEAYDLPIFRVRSAPRTDRMIMGNLSYDSFRFHLIPLPL
ncbi:hypothetical protein, partial [Litorimonas sp.]|uniref:hypothetical protein n=1 Tax=Litorimonas sp. TaxID=1892381 RepID=UPI003A86CF28